MLHNPIFRGYQMPDGVDIRLTGLEAVRDLEKKLKKAVAKALNQAGQEAADASRAAIQRSFTLRTPWWQPGNAMGLKQKFAKPDSLTAAISTRAHWLDIHETGGQKRPQQGQSVVVPTAEVKRNAKGLIPKTVRKKILDPNSTKYFRLETRKGPVIAERVGKRNNQRLRILFGLEPQVRIKKQNTFSEPITRAVKARFPAILKEQIDQIT